jgi:hypothetical protein
MKFTVPCHKNQKLSKVVKKIQSNKELQAFLKCGNVNAIDRLGYSDHGPVHVKIVSNLALELLRILVKNGVTPSVVKHHDLENDDAEVVVVLGALLHDIGMAVHRAEHDKTSLLIASQLMDDLLANYDLESKTIIKSEVMHAIISHEEGIKPLTVEAGIVTIADALDMSEGRARIPFDKGDTDIYSVSALAIKSVTVDKNGAKPITIHIEMTNSAGIFQVDNLLKPRVEESGLKDHVSVIAEVKGKERSILHKVEL